MSLYSLNEMHLVGYGFSADTIHKKAFRRTYLDGDLSLNGNFFRARVCVYANGRSSMLIDVLGNDKQEAELNLKKIVEHMSYCIAHNVNGLGTMVKNRRRLRFFKNLANILAIATLWYSIFNFSLSGYSNNFFSIVLSCIVCIICVACNKLFVG